MSEQTPASASLTLPDNPNLDWLRKAAKKHLAELRKSDPKAKLADAQFAIAKEYGFPSWRALKAHIDSLTVDGQLQQAIKEGDVEELKAMLALHPGKLHVRFAPYEWSLLHVAAQAGQLAIVDYLLERGVDPNYRERGDNTYPMHWAAAHGHVEVVKRLADAGGDVIGEGDDHAGGVIGWASCWEGCNDDFHRAIVDFLISRGARHHIFSAIALNLGDEVRRIVAEDPAALNQRQSRNENHRTPLHFAVHMNRPEMVRLLLELGADPLAVDGDGMPVAMYAKKPDTDRPVMQKIRDMTLAEFESARRGHRLPNCKVMDLLAALSVRDWKLAVRIVEANPQLLNAGALHLSAKRGDAGAVNWLLQHGADRDAKWAHWDSEVTALHLAVLADHPEVARLLLDKGADPTIHDSKHDSDAPGWAEFMGRPNIVAIIKAHVRANEE
jgi:ankyrin repeat protein